MNITEPYGGKSDFPVMLEYSDAESFGNLPKELCRQVYAVCFVGDEMVVGYGGNKKSWGLIGGTIEPGETFEQTLHREIIEEANMDVISFAPVGYQKVVDSRDGSFFYQLRYVCKAVPRGPFISDPAGGITEIKLIDPRQYKKYFDWGKIGQRIIDRALELKDTLK